MTHAEMLAIECTAILFATKARLEVYRENELVVDVYRLHQIEMSNLRVRYAVSRAVYYLTTTRPFARPTGELAETHDMLVTI